MAFIRFKNRKFITVTPEKGAAIWLVKTGEVRGTPAQYEFCKQVDRIYLNPSNAPKSYLDTYAPLLRGMTKPLAVQTRLPYAD